MSSETGRMSTTVAETIAALRLRPEHAALAEMARQLAGILDASVPGERAHLEAWHKLAPRLAGVLRELGATPGARRPAGGDDDDDSDPVDDGEERELQRRADARRNRATGVDPAAS